MAYSLVEKDIELKYRGNSPSPLHNEKDSLVNGIDTRPNTPAAQSKMQRKLLGRHLTMIAIGGTIGTGLFLKSGSAIGRAGIKIINIIRRTGCLVSRWAGSTAWSLHGVPTVHTGRTIEARVGDIRALRLLDLKKIDSSVILLMTYSN